MTRGDFGSELAHCPTSDKALHGMVAVVPFAAGLSHEADAIMSRFGDSWTHNLKQLIISVEGICPDWRPQREDLLNQADLCKKMRDNKHYNKIGALARELKDQRTMIKKFQGNQTFCRPVDASVLKHAGQAVDFGVETVAFTYLLFRVQSSWLTIDDVPQAEQAVLKLKADLAPSAVGHYSLFK